MKKGYIERLAEKELKTKLHSSGCVLVCGPKFCGKSKMSEQYAKSTFQLKTVSEIELASSDPRLVLVGEKPHLIDEWQKVPDIWNYIKDDLDQDYEFGKYILTGSTTPVDSSKIQHSGAGRITRMLLKPFSLYESNESLGKVSLMELFNKKNESDFIVTQDDNTSLADIAFYICRGGWPISVLSEKEYSIETTKNYYEGLFNIENESDDFVLLLKNKDIDLLKLILKSYARNISTQCKKTKMISDILESGIRKTLDDNTFDSYIKVLKDLFIVFDLPAWNLNLRTSVSVRTSPTHHFIDTSIATAALDINPNDLLNDMKTFGYFFEDFAIRDLSIYAQANRASLKHYRDSSGQEVDAIVELKNGNYGAIEIKIASEKNIEEGIKSLTAFEKKLLKANLKTPSFKMILTSHGNCYKKDGIYIVPITYLKD